MSETFPCVGHNGDQVASIAFTEEILSQDFLGFDFGGFFESVFTGHKTTFEGVVAVKQTNYLAPTAYG